MAGNYGSGMGSGFGSWLANNYMQGMSSAQLSSMNQSMSNASPYAAAINVIGDVFGVIGDAYAAKAQAQAVKYQYEAQALSAQFQADASRLNAQIAAYEGTRKQIAFAQNAAISGFQAAQAMANTRVQQSHSGVRMDSTSSQQVRANQQFSRAVDMATTEQNRIELLNQSQQQVTNYLTSAGLAQASADSARQAAASVTPGSAFNAALVTGLMGVAHNEATGMFQTFQNNLQKINLTEQQKAQGYADMGWGSISSNGMGASSASSGWGKVSALDVFNTSSNSGFGIGSGMTV